MTIADFTEAYQGVPPWDVDRPQPAVVGLAEEDGFTGRVLDVGCGTGENSLYLAARGLSVLGISELTTGDYPKITRTEIAGTFAEGWTIDRIQAATYATTSGDVPAWLVSLHRR